MEQGKKDSNYKSSIWIIIIAMMNFALLLFALGLWKLAELIKHSIN